MDAEAARRSIRLVHSASGDGGMESLELLRDWVAYMDVTGLSPKTIKLYRYSLVRFLADSLTPLPLVTEQVIVDYLAATTDRAGTRTSYLRAFKSFFGWAEERGHVDRNPVGRIKIKGPRRGAPPEFFDDERMTRLVIAAAVRKPVDPRRPWTILLAYGTGARLGSLANVMPDDVRPGSIHFRVTKNDRPYAVPLGPVAMAATRELLALRDFVPAHSAGRLPTLIGVREGAIWQWVSQAGKDAGFRAWTHGLRHTFATKMAHGGADMRTLQELMNHVDLSQLPRYVGVTDARKREAVGLL